MPLEFGFRDIGNDVILELAGAFEVGGTAMGTLLRMNFMLNERGVRRRLGSKVTRVLAVLFAPPIRL